MPKVSTSLLTPSTHTSEEQHFKLSPTDVQYINIVSIGCIEYIRFPTGGPLGITVPIKDLDLDKVASRRNMTGFSGQFSTTCTTLQKSDSFRMVSYLSRRLRFGTIVLYG